MESVLLFHITKPQKTTPSGVRYKPTQIVWGSAFYFARYYTLSVVHFVYFIALVASTLELLRYQFS